MISTACADCARTNTEIGLKDGGCRPGCRNRFRAEAVEPAAEQELQGHLFQTQPNMRRVYGPRHLKQASRPVALVEGPIEPDTLNDTGRTIYDFE